MIQATQKVAHTHTRTATSHHVSRQEAELRELLTYRRTRVAKLVPEQGSRHKLVDPTHRRGQASPLLFS